MPHAANTRLQEQQNGGRGDHTRVYIANTRRSAQFSLGAGET